MKRKNGVYIFVDTNIFLDYYRVSSEASLKLLQKMDAIKGAIISTYQVEMEFKKNRQTVINETLKSIKFDTQKQLPATFHDTAIAGSLSSLKKDAQKKEGILKKKFLSLLKSPKSSDPVYKALESIFHNPSSHVLTRDMAERHRIKRLAWRRFMLGYPPRKKNDTSVGDAFNWEWIIHCGKTLPGKIIIVSRDGDYGLHVDGKSFLNDHLLQEYKERVGSKRVISLTDRLSVALKELDVPVTPSEKKAEESQLKSDGAHAGIGPLAQLAAALRKMEAMDADSGDH